MGKQKQARAKEADRGQAGDEVQGNGDAPIKTIGEVAVDRLSVLAVVSPERQEQIDEEIASFERRLQQNKTTAFESRLERDLGRFAECSFSNYELKYKEQKAVIQRLNRIAVEIDRFITEGRQLILYGSIGCGKDHLAASLLRVAAGSGHEVRWAEGRGIYDNLAAAFSENSTQAELYRELSEPAVLCLSDPVWVDGWTDKHKHYAAGVIRRRYDRGKSTWVTMNVKDESQAEQLFGADVWSRLCHHAAIVECRWPDYRMTTR